jgi:hypothetical protein
MVEVKNMVVAYPAGMPGAPYYAEAFSPLPGRCFRMVAHPGEAGPGQRPGRLASRRAVPAHAQLQVHSVACPLHLGRTSLSEPAVTITARRGCGMPDLVEHPSTGLTIDFS